MNKKPNLFLIHHYLIKDGLWKQESENIIDSLTKKHYLNFGNIGSNNISIFVTVAKKSEYETLTSEGDKTLSQTKLEIDEYPALVADDSLKSKGYNGYCLGIR